jgi:hypothetical protein
MHTCVVCRDSICTHEAEGPPRLQPPGKAVGSSQSPVGNHRYGVEVTANVYRGRYVGTGGGRNRISLRKPETRR